MAPLDQRSSGIFVKLILSLCLYLLGLSIFQPFLFANVPYGGSAYLLSAFIDSPDSYFTVRDEFGYFPFLTNLVYSQVFLWPSAVWPLVFNWTSVLTVFGFTHLFLLRRFRAMVADDNVRLLVAFVSSVFLVGWDAREPQNSIIVASAPLLFYGLNQFINSDREPLVARTLVPLLAFSKPLAIAISPVYLVGLFGPKNKRLWNLLTVTMFGVSLAFAADVLDGQDSRIGQFGEAILSAMLIFLKLAGAPFDWVLLEVGIRGDLYYLAIGLLGGAIVVTGNTLLFLSDRYSEAQKAIVFLLQSVILANIAAVCLTYGYLWNYQNLANLVIYPTRHSFIIFFSTILGAAILSQPLLPRVTNLGLISILAILCSLNFLPLFSQVSPLVLQPNRDLQYDTLWVETHEKIVSGLGKCAPASHFGNFVGEECQSLIVPIESLNEELLPLAENDFRVEYVIVHELNSETTIWTAEVCHENRYRRLGYRLVGEEDERPEYARCDSEIRLPEDKRGSLVQILFSNFD